MTVALLAPEDLKTLLDKGRAVLVDVRDPVEYKQENIPRALNIPLASLDAQSLGAFAGKKLVFQCQSGRRSQEACSRVSSLPGDVASLEGGIDAWKKAGLPVSAGRQKAVLPLMRQVQLAIGIFVITGAVLAYALSPYFLIIPLVMGAGLVNAGLTGWCGLARLMAVMPWNR